MRTDIGASAVRALVVMLALLLSAPMLADGGKSMKRVKFPRGRTSAILKGTIKKGNEMVYILGASEGQTLSAHISTPSRNNDVVFTILAPDGSDLLEEGELTTDWSGTLPTSGDYRIVVGVIESKKAGYTLEITIR